MPLFSPPGRSFIAAGMILLEVSVVVFLLQGYLATGMQVSTAQLRSAPLSSAQLSSAQLSTGHAGAVS